MYNLYLLYKFNSYHNRILKRFDTLAEYEAAIDSYGFIEGCNFDYGDGVTTKHQYLRNDVSMDVILSDEDTPNYLLVCDEQNQILSRWFITDAIKNSAESFEIVLLRDAIADYKTEILDAPTYIEKATLNIEDPFIYNKEDIQFNQIKTDENVIKDITGSPWIVGFIASNQPEGTESALAGMYQGINSTTADKTYTQMSAAPFWNYLTDYGLNYWPYKVIATSGYNTYFFFTLKFDVADRNQSVYFTYKYNTTEGLSVFECYIDALTSHSPYALYAVPQYANGTVIRSGNIYDLMVNMKNSITPEMIQALISYSAAAGSLKTDAQFESDLRQYNTKTIYVNNASPAHPYTTKTYPQGYYSFDLSAPNSGAGYGGWSDTVDYTTGSIVRGSDVDNAFRQMIYNNYRQYIDVVSASGYDLVTVMCEAKCYGVYMDDIYTANTQVTLTGNEPALKDAPYRMFAMPYNDNQIQWTHVGGSSTITSDKNVNMSIAQALSAKLSGTWLYDLQLVPFCPFANSSSIISVSNNVVSIDCSQFESNQLTIANGNVAVIIWCRTSQIENYTASYVIPEADTALQKKINNQCDMWRLSSPSYNSSFEFSVEKNHGVDNFNIDFAYKPYESYIHINPNFNGLYGIDYNDTRGLIFNGPFSLPQTSSQWMQYKLNNLNYRDTFDREIEHIDKEYKWGQQKAGISAIAGALQGAAGGAAIGSYTGVGAIAGATVGAGVSLAGAAADMYYNKLSHEEAVDYKKDLFNMDLQNVQARANTLNKVSAYVPNNKVFPVLEYYTCTTDEKTAFKNKLYYNGMTVGRIGTIRSFLQSEPSYIKGQLIRLNINEDNHLVEHIANELNKGVFI